MSADAGRARRTDASITRIDTADTAAHTDAHAHADTASDADADATSSPFTTPNPAIPRIALIAAMLLLLVGLAYFVFGRRTPAAPTAQNAPPASTSSTTSSSTPTSPTTAPSGAPPLSAPPTGSQPTDSRASEPPVPPNTPGTPGTLGAPSGDAASTTDSTTSATPGTSTTATATPATEAAATQQMDALAASVRRGFARRQRHRALDELARAPAQLRGDPRMQALVSEFTGIARRDADAAHAAAMRAAAPTRAADAFKRAESQWQFARNAAARAATLDTLRGLVLAQDLLDAATASATRGQTPAAGAQTDIAPTGGDTANRPTSAAPPPTTTPSTTTPSTTTANTTPTPPVTPSNRPPTAGSGESTTPTTPAGTTTRPGTQPSSSTPTSSTPNANSASGSAAPTAPVDERAAVQRALDAWAAAYATLDVGRVASVVPLSSQQMKALKEGFDSQTAHRVTLDNCQITPNGASASAVCGVQRAMTFKDGKSHQASARVRFQLERRNGAWVITSQR